MGKMLTLASTGHLAASTGGGGGNYTFLIVIVVLFALFYFVMIRPQRNRQRRVQEMQNQIGPGQRIRTTAGMYGTVTSIDGDNVTLEVAPGVHVQFMRRAVMDVVPDTDGAAATTFGGSTAGDATGSDGTAADATVTGEPAADPAAEAGPAAEPEPSAEPDGTPATKGAKPGAAEDGTVTG